MIVDVMQALASAVRDMAKKPVPDTPKTVNASALSPNGPGTTETHFCGIDYPILSMDHRYN